MKKIILEIEFDDSDCYDGKYDNIPETIKNLVEFEMYHSLESDYIIKNGWKVNLIESEQNQFRL
jgi:hypothetical protein